MKIGIIGAGMAGLVSAKNCLEHGFEVVIFEKTNKLAGCWNYTEKVGLDENDLLITTGMYRDLKTNLPKEVMYLNGLEHTKGLKSYINQEYILEYLLNYAEKFNIIPYVKFYKQVINVKPESGKWFIQVQDSKTKVIETFICDAVMACNGHFTDKRMPKIKGMERFLGPQIHSQDFRLPEHFADQKVLVIGAGPSGSDIAKHCARKARKVCISHKPDVVWFVPKAPEVDSKPIIESIDEHGCFFKDGSYEEFDAIIYCTGYNYELPFLSKECGLVLEDNWVKHVYRHTINIEHPTMAIICLAYGTSVFPMADLMARYFLAHLTKKFELPSKEVMLERAMEEQQYRYSLGWPERYAHKIPDSGQNLATKIANEAQIPPIQPVLFKIYDYIKKEWNDTDCFDVLDDARCLINNKIILE